MYGREEVLIYMIENKFYCSSCKLKRSFIACQVWWQTGFILRQEWLKTNFIVRQARLKTSFIVHQVWSQTLFDRYG